MIRQKMFTRKIAVLLGSALLMLLFTGISRAASTGRYLKVIEAEDATASSNQWKRWKLEGASSGKALRCTMANITDHMQLGTATVPAAGHYRVWVRVCKTNPGSLSLVLLLRDAQGQEEGFTTIDWDRTTMAPQPYKPSKTRSEQAPGFYWYPFDVTLETAGEKSIWVAGLRHEGKNTTRYVDCVVITSDLAMDVANTPLAELQDQTFTAKRDIPQGYQAAQMYPMNANFFASSTERKEQLKLGAVTQIGLFRDYARFVQIGLNSDNASRNGEASAYGIKGAFPLDSFNASAYPREGETYEYYKQFMSKLDPKQTHFINSDGQIGKALSLSDPQLPEYAHALLKRRFETAKDDLDIEMWRIAWEQKGWLDYSPVSVRAFHDWLKDKHQTIDKLNSHWHSQYADFDAITPPTQAIDNMACWLEFNRFCSEVYADAVARQVQWVRELDPQHRTITTQSSSLMLLSPFFTNKFPQDWETFINRVYDKDMIIGWDGYAADDFNGCRVDLLRSLSRGIPLMHKECNIHSGDPRIAARTFWMELCKGSKGVNWFFYQTWDKPAPDKFSLLNDDQTPRQMLGAVGDVAVNARRVEPILMQGTVTPTVKPVGIYYSRMDLSVTPPNPISVWGGAANNHYHVYEMLRQLGYPVQWVTPDQIRSGALEQLSALVMVECQFVPRQVSGVIAQWVQQGGVLLGDRLPGGFDEYGQPQGQLQKLFGIQPIRENHEKRGKIALEDAAMGYGPETALALEADQISQSVAEIWNHKTSTHPVSQTVGEFFISGFGLTRVQCIDGTVVGLTLAGKYPGIILNDVGQGHTLYSAAMLGSWYNSAATGFEMQNQHSGIAHLKLLDSFLKYAGAQPSYHAENLSPEIAQYLRVESPIVTAERNALIGITNMSDRPIDQILLTMPLPDDLANAPLIFWSAGSSRQLIRLHAEKQGKNWQFKIPSIDVYGTLLLINNLKQPLVSLETQGLKQAAAGLPGVHPNDAMTLQATVWNTSQQALTAGRMSLYLPDGWYQNQISIDCATINPGQSQTVEFRVKAGPYAQAKRLRPMVVKYLSDTVTSTPCTQLIWWMPSKIAFN
jgi:hypothetical protein